jgi:hypothetical protein
MFIGKEKNCLPVLYHFFLKPEGMVIPAELHFYLFAFGEFPVSF